MGPRTPLGVLGNRAGDAPAGMKLARMRSRSRLAGCRGRPCAWRRGFPSSGPEVSGRWLYGFGIRGDGSSSYCTRGIGIARPRRRGPGVVQSPSRRGCSPAPEWVDPGPLDAVACPRARRATASCGRHRPRRMHAEQGRLRGTGGECMAVLAPPAADRRMTAMLGRLRRPRTPHALQAACMRLGDRSAREGAAGRASATRPATSANPAEAHRQAVSPCH